MRIGCVILAAGNAARFGANKLLALYGGIPLIQRAFEALPAPLPGPAAVVTQYDAVAALAEARGLAVIRNGSPELGVSRSVVLGTEGLGPGCDGLLFLVADQPLLRRQTVEALLARFRAEPSRIVVPRAEGRQGNPCVFPAALFPELAALAGDRGGKQIIRRHPELVTELPVPPRELWDVDSLEDLQKVLYISE